MPTVYQLVPGSMIAKLWFNSLFPPSTDQSDYEAQNNVFSNLMVIATSLAVGLVLGLALARLTLNVWNKVKVWCKCLCCCCKEPKTKGWKEMSFYQE